MKQIDAVILSGSDRVLRAGVGAWLIATVLGGDGVPEWLALLATYPIFTAILARDPVYSLVVHLRNALRGSTARLRDVLPSGTHAAT